MEITDSLCTRNIGMFHGYGVIHFPNGAFFKGIWKLGVLTQGQYCYKDNLEYKPNDWNYCNLQHATNPDRRFHHEIVREKELQQDPAMLEKKRLRDERLRQKQEARNDDEEVKLREEKKTNMERAIEKLAEAEAESLKRTQQRTTQEDSQYLPDEQSGKAKVGNNYDELIHNELERRQKINNEQDQEDNYDEDKEQQQITAPPNDEEEEQFHEENAKDNYNEEADLQPEEEEYED